MSTEPQIQFRATLTASTVVGGVCAVCAHGAAQGETMTTEGACPYASAAAEANAPVVARWQRGEYGQEQAHQRRRVVGPGDPRSPFLSQSSRPLWGGAGRADAR